MDHILGLLLLLTGAIMGIVIADAVKDHPRGRPDAFVFPVAFIICVGVAVASFIGSPLLVAGLLAAGLVIGYWPGHATAKILLG